MDIQTLDLRTINGYTNIGFQNFKWIYQTLDIRTLNGYTNIGYQNIKWIYKHWISEP